jgi:TPR repeat protein
MAPGSDAKKRLFRQTLKSARVGAAEAQYELGLMYANGVGVEPSIEQAVHWVAQAAQRGLAAAQYLLGTRYASGIGVPQSEHQAVVWLAKAAEQGHAKAQLRLAQLYARPHVAQAAELTRAAAEAGLATAQLALSQAYAEGTGVAQDADAALRWCQKAAEQGLAAAQHALADRYAQGDGVARDPALVLDWYRRAAAQDHVASYAAIARLGGEREQTAAASTRSRSAGQERRRAQTRWNAAAENGNADAKYHLGWMYAHGIGQEHDAAQAAYWLGQAAAQNHVQAQCALGALCEQARDPQALQWYEKAAAQGDADAQCALGRLYCEGTLGAPRPWDGLAWNLRAAQQGHAQAMLQLGLRLRADAEAASLQSLEAAAQRGLAQAQFLLAQHYERGQGVEKSLSKAFFWFEKAAQQALPEAMAALGVALHKGLGVAADFTRAWEWLHKAAALGDARAQWNVGAVYASGAPGVARDLKLAFVWCQRSAEQGFAAAQSNLGALYALADNPKQAALWWHKAAAQNDAEALYNLALVTAKGTGVDQDLGQSVALLLRAAHLGLAPAQARLGLLYANGDGVVQDPIEAHKWFAIAADNGDASARANAARCAGINSGPAVAEALRRSAAWKITRFS